MITLKKEPFWWSAAHSPVLYEFDYETLLNWGATEYNSTGKMCVVLTTLHFSETPEAGQYIFIGSGRYKGLHRISDYVILLGLPVIVTDTDYTGTQTGSGVVKLKLITEHVFTLSAGYGTGDAFVDDLPEQTLATFKPEVDLSTGTLKINISGYLKSLFAPENYLREFTYGALTYLTGLFNTYKLTWAGTISGGQSTRMVLNSALTQLQLQSYTTGLQALSAQAVPVTFDCETYLTYINGAGAYLKTELEPSLPDFNPDDFSNDFENGG